MNVEEIVQYWLESAEDDWPVIQHLVESGDYRHALFFGHLYLEKLLKALVVRATESHAPRTHNLLFLAERADLDLSEETSDLLLRVTGKSIDTRYPEAPGQEEKYTKNYVKNELQEIKEVGEWLKSRLKAEKS